jgi:G3E family GTPase
MTPVALLTGFLGSGKTTVLSHLLMQPGFSRTAVIINEFGEVGLDHELVERSEDAYIQLASGCLCCKLRSDLAMTLSDMLARRATGDLPAFERIVIETSGLADPAPVLQTLMTDTSLVGELVLDSVVTTVDAVNGAGTLAREPTSLKQVAVADRLVVTKTDLTDGDDSGLHARLAQINPSAQILCADHGRIDPNRLLGASAQDAVARLSGIDAWLGDAAHADHGHGDHAEILSFVLTREEPIRAVTLTLFLETLAEHCGEDLLRLKGIVSVAESPERPAVIHGVQHVFHPPTWLARWPSEDHRSRMVFIGRRLSPAWTHALLEALEDEVRTAST